MNRTGISFTLCICLSLAVHVGVLTYSAEHYARTSLYNPPAMRRLPGVLISLARKPIPPPPPPPPDPREDIGDATGIGDSNFGSPGDRPMQAPKSDESQAWYTHQAPGQRRQPNPHARADDPTLGENGRGGPAGQAAQALAEAIKQVEAPPEAHDQPAPKAVDPAKVAPPTPKSPPTPPSPAVAVPIAILPAPDPHGLFAPSREPPPIDLALAAPAPTPPPIALPAPTPPPAPARAASGDGRQPGALSAAGDPAPPSDTDSDPFSKQGSAVFHNGKLDVRFGRKAKLTRPDITIAGDADMFGIGNATVILKISIDPTGQVSDVSIVQSSGSNQIDQPTLVAAYHWQFEPRRDANGKPVPDVIVFTVKYQ